MARRRAATGDGSKVKEAKKLEEEKVEKESPWTSARLFPEYAIHALLFIVLVGRLGIANDKATWWVLHPDESYQAVEVAHSEIYGYGFRSYEYYSPIRDGSPLDNEASAAEHIAIGMHATRSWIPVRLYATAFYLKEQFAIKTRPYQFIKIIHTAISGFLPLVVFLMMYNLEQEFPQDVATVAAALVAFTDYFVLLGTHTFLETLTAPVTFLAIALFYFNREQRRQMVDGNCNDLTNGREVLCGGDSKSRKNQRMKEPDRRNGEVTRDQDFNLLLEQDDSQWKIKTISNMFLSGFLIGITSYADPRTVFVFPVTYISLFIFNRNLPGVTVRVSHFVFFLLGLIGALVCGSFDDLCAYGTWFESPFRWFTFWYHQAGKVFGSEDPYFYLQYVASSPLLVAQFITIIFTLALFLACKLGLFPGISVLQRWMGLDRNTITLTASLLLASCFLVLIHSCWPHKDVRYIHDALVLLACSSATASFALFKLLRLLLLEEKQEKLVVALKMLVFAEVLMGVVRSSSSYPSARHLTLGGLVPDRYWESAHVSACLDFVGRQSDVTGVVLDHSIHRILGTTILHLDVPILGKTYYDFREWSKETRSQIPFKMLKKDSKVSLWTFDSVSNFFAEENGLLVLRHLIKNDHYNYAILTDNRSLPKSGFRELFRSGNATVFKRMRSRKAVEELRLISNKVTAKNATVLAYEASWLLAFGLPKEAFQRSNMALQLDDTCGICWQLSYWAMKMVDESQANVIAEQCFAKIGQGLCQKRYKRILVHREYGLGLARPGIPLPIK